LGCKYWHIDIGNQGKTFTPPRRTLSSITRSWRFHHIDRFAPGTSTHPLALNSTRRLPSGMSVITWFGWNRKSRATRAAQVPQAAAFVIRHHVKPRVSSAAAPFWSALWPGIRALQWADP